MAKGGLVIFQLARKMITSVDLWQVSYTGLTQLRSPTGESRCFVSWRAAEGGEAIPPDGGGDCFGGLRPPRNDTETANCVTSVIYKEGVTDGKN